MVGQSCGTTKSPLGLTFPDFDLAPKQNDKFGYCGLDLE